MARPSDPSQQGPILNVAGEREVTQPQFRDFGVVGPTGAQVPTYSAMYGPMPASLAQAGNSTSLPPSINPWSMMNPTMQTQQLLRLQQDMVASSERIATYLARAADKAEILADAAAGTPGAGGRRGRRPTVPVGRDPVDKGRDLLDQSQDHPYTPSPASAGDVRTTDEMRGAAAEAPMRTLQDLRHRALRGINRRISELHIGGDEPMGFDPSALRYRNLETGRFATAEAGMRFERGQKVAGIIQNFVGGLEGAGPMEALQGALPKYATAIAAPVLGYQIASNIRDQAIAQRAANAQWQRVLGGSNAEGFGERIGERLFQFQAGWFGGMGSEQAGQLYEGAADIYGRDRRARNITQDFGLQAYRQFGMSVQQSLELVRIEAEAGNTSLAGLADSLRAVRQEAREAGVSAEAMIKKFTQNLQATTQTVGGAAGTAVAGAQTAFQTSLGQQFTGLDLSGLSGDQAIMIQAAQSGMTRAQFLAKSAEDPTFLASAQSRQMQTLGAQILGNRPGAMQFLQQFVQDKGGNMNPGDWTTLGRELQRRFNIDPSVVAQVFAGQGVTGLTPANAVQFLATVMSSQGDLGQRATDIQGQAAQTQMGGDLTSRINDQSFKDLAKSLGFEESDLSAVRAGLRGGQDAMQASTMDTRIGQMREQYGYLQSVAKYGTRNPLVEKLIQNPGRDQYKWTVDTAKGKATVSTADLIRYYQDQVQAGTATVAEGPEGDIGKTISAVVGLPGQQGLTGDSAGKDPMGKAKVQEGQQGGKVTVELQPWLQRYFRLIPQGNVTTSQQNGVPTPGNQDPTNFGN